MKTIATLLVAIFMMLLTMHWEGMGASVLSVFFASLCVTAGASVLVDCYLNGKELP